MTIFIHSLRLRIKMYQKILDSANSNFLSKLRN